MWHFEHSSSISAFASAGSMLSRRTPASQYGSRADFAIIVGRQENPIEMSSPPAVERRLWQAKQRWEGWNNSFLSFVSAALLVVSVKNKKESTAPVMTIRPF